MSQRHKVIRSCLLSLLLPFALGLPLAPSFAAGKSYSVTCQQEIPAFGGNAYHRAFWHASGQRTDLYISEQEPHSQSCQSQRLPFDVAQVEWATLISDDIARQLDRGLILEGSTDKHNAFAPDNVSALEEETGNGPRRARKHRHPGEQHSNGAENSFSSEKASSDFATETSLLAQGKQARATFDEFKTQQKDKANFIKSGWIWQPSAWQERPEETLQKLKRWNMRQVYITVPVEDGQDTVEKPDLLKQFITQAHAQGVAVWAVEGDRYALLPKEQKSFLHRAKVYDAFNKTAAPDQRLSGVQYDIEPYLMAGYSLEASSWNTTYLEFLKSLKQETHLPVEIVLPFWFERQKAGNQWFLDQLAPVVDALAIMDYRTDIGQIQHFAQPYLEWGEDYHKPVQIALETMELPDTPTQVYRPGFSGTVYLLRKNNLNLLVLLKTPIKAPLLGKSFTFSHASSGPAKHVTFYGQADHLTETLKSLKPELNAWDSFAGIALHGIE